MPPAPSDVVHGLTLDVLPRGEDTGVNEFYVFHRNEVPVVKIGRRSSHAREDRLDGSESGIVELRCPVVSRAHARLMYSDGKVLAVDRGSHHGTFLRRQGQDRSIKLDHDVPVVVNTGDVLTFGKIVGAGNTIVHPISVRVGVLSERNERSASNQVLAPKIRGHFSTDFELSDSTSSASGSESELELPPFAPTPSKPSIPSSPGLLSSLPQKRAASPWRLQSLLRPSSAGTSTSIPGLSALPSFRNLLCSKPGNGPGGPASMDDVLPSPTSDSDGAARSENSDGDQSSDMDLESETGREPVSPAADNHKPSEDERPYTPEQYRGAGRLSPAVDSPLAVPRDGDVTFESGPLNSSPRAENRSAALAYWPDLLDDDMYQAWTPPSFVPSFQCGTCVEPSEYPIDDTPRAANTNHVPEIVTIHAPIPAVPGPALGSRVWEPPSDEMEMDIPGESAEQKMTPPPSEAVGHDQQDNFRDVEASVKRIEQLESTAKKTKDAMWYLTSNTHLLEEKLGRATTQLGDVQAVLDGHTHQLDLARADTDALAQSPAGLGLKSKETHTQIRTLVERVTACESAVEQAKANMSIAAVNHGSLAEELRGHIAQIRQLVEELREAHAVAAPRAHLTMPHDGPQVDADIVPLAQVTPTTDLADPTEAIRAAQMEALAAISAAAAAMCASETRAEGSLKRKRPLSEGTDDESGPEANALMSRPMKRARTPGGVARGVLNTVAAAAAGAVAAVVVLSQL